VTAVVSRASLEDQGRGIVESLGGKWSSNGGMCCCPAHNDRTPSLSVRVGDRSLLFHCFSGCESLDVIRALRRDGQVNRDGIGATHEDRPKKTYTDSGMAQRLWDASRPIAGTLAETYLERRAITARSDQLRFHPRAQLGNKAEARYFPALLAAVCDDRGLVAVHRTFLDPKTGWKAAISEPRRMLGRPAKGAVRLTTPEHILGLAEGIETSFAATQLFGLPVWAVLGNERFGMVSIPAHVERLVILADNDAGGRRAAGLAQNGLQRDDMTIEMVWPPATENDWADVLIEGRGEKAVAD